MPHNSSYPVRLAENGIQQHLEWLAIGTPQVSFHVQMGILAQVSQVVDQHYIHYTALALLLFNIKPSWLDDSLVLLPN